ncbi:MAG TPA: family 78 glycoside hydrolase catalytic domain [Bacteroidales bacterium]|nr:family 78 glycoside hydrolase catalytic domain [Bacteroidales bacterium]HOK74805.1 family 78 glycoside hydrolase catalytic domain [Bacteroidales bacterium]HOM41421.1 family 78 glycoside hydrolase catalytic domain [Bacteroidales bacterium]HPP93366.1 family 78 glycoside hydrolase catalytic domain [Bacteroidales bacterium]HRR16681.1 family 78 glycoside hydrolase catalytic domain [Bacteroidales bacterium]
MKQVLFALFLIIAVSLHTEAQFVTEFIPPVRVVKVAEDAWFADFGKDAFGTLVLNLKVKLPDTLIVRLGEKLTEPCKIDRKPGGSVRYAEVKLPVDPSREKYIIKLPADKRNTSPPAVALPDTFGVIMPFRYCEIENYNGVITEDNIRQKAYFWKFNPEASAFSSSDTILNRVWDLCKYSIKATSFAGLYIDGDRERIPYEADAYINQLSHYAVDSEYTLARRTMEHFINNPTWPTEWILHTVMMFYQDYMYTGDISLFLKYYEQLKTKTLVDLARDDGLISSKSPKLNGEMMRRLGFRDTTQRIRDIVDWPPAQKDTGWKLATPEGERDGYDMKDINTVVNCFHYINLEIMSEIAGRLGKREDSLWFANRAALVKASINNKLFDSRKGIYIDGEGSEHSSIHANMLPLAFGIVPENAINSVLNFIKSRGMACSVYGAQYLLEGLYNAGEADYALSLLTSTTDRSWWNMIRSGSTITMEAWDMKYKPNSDWNHAWGSAPANIIVRYLWGIKPLEPGFARAEIKPQPGSLKWSTITAPTIKGQIKASFRKKRGSEKYLIDIPEGMKAEFVPPPSLYKWIVLNGKKYDATINRISLKTGKNIIILKQ